MGSARFFFFTGLRLPSRRDLGLRVGLGGLGVELLEDGTPALQTLSLDFKASFSTWCFVRIEGIHPCSNKVLYVTISCPNPYLRGQRNLVSIFVIPTRHVMVPVVPDYLQ